MEAHMALRFRFLRLLLFLLSNADNLLTLLSAELTVCQALFETFEIPLRWQRCIVKMSPELCFE